MPLKLTKKVLREALGVQRAIFEIRHTYGRAKEQSNL